jgi:hypothetical protein
MLEARFFLCYHNVALENVSVYLKVYAEFEWTFHVSTALIITTSFREIFNS